MATLNEMIAQGAQFNIPDPVVQYNKLAQMQQYKTQNELSQQEAIDKATERQRLVSDRTRRATFLTGLSAKLAEKGHTLDRDTLVSMMSSGIPDIEKLAFEGFKALSADEAFNKAEGGPSAKTAPAPAPTPAPVAVPRYDSTQPNVGAETFVSTGVGATNFNGTATRLNPTTGEVEPVPLRENQAAAGLFDSKTKTYSPFFGTLALTAPQIVTRLNNKLAALTDNPPEGMTPQMREQMIAAVKEEIIAATERATPTPTNAMAPQAPAAAAVTNAMASAPAPAAAPAASPQTQLQSLVDKYERFSKIANPDKRVENRIKFLTEEIARVSKRNLHTVQGVGLVDADTNQIVYASQEKGNALAELQANLAAATDPKVRKEIQARIDKEISHQPATSVTVSTEKTYGGKLADKLADRDDAKLGAAEKAPQLAESANRIISLVSQGNLFTGPIAGIKLNIARYLNVVGASNEEKISNTESLIAATGQSTLDAIKSAGLGTGQGFTDKDLKFLQQIAGGTFELTPQTLTKLATLQHQAAVRSVDSWNTRFTQIPSSATGALGLSTVPKILPLATAALAPADKQALDWANANPKDPRSLQIKQRLGQ